MLWKRNSWFCISVCYFSAWVLRVFRQRSYPALTCSNICCASVCYVCSRLSDFQHETSKGLCGRCRSCFILAHRTTRIILCESKAEVQCVGFPLRFAGRCAHCQVANCLHSRAGVQLSSPVTCQRKRGGAAAAAYRGWWAGLAIQVS